MVSRVEHSRSDHSSGRKGLDRFDPRCQSLKEFSPLDYFVQSSGNICAESILSAVYYRIIPAGGTLSREVFDPEVKVILESVRRGRRI